MLLSVCILKGDPRLYTDGGFCINALEIDLIDNVMNQLKTSKPRIQSPTRNGALQRK